MVGDRKFWGVSFKREMPWDALALCDSTDNVSFSCQAGGFWASEVGCYSSSRREGDVDGY